MDENKNITRLILSFSSEKGRPKEWAGIFRMLEEIGPHSGKQKDP